MDQSAEKIEPALHPKVRGLTLVAHQAIVDDRFGTAALPESNLRFVWQERGKEREKRSMEEEKK